MATLPAGRDPVRPMLLNGAATVTLCWRQKASHFWIILLLVAGTADHGMIPLEAHAYFDVFHLMLAQLVDFI